MADFLTETRAGYDALVAEYVELFPSVTEPEAVALAAFAEAVPPGKVLEAGSGTGRVTGWLHARAWTSRASNWSPGMLAVARTTCPDITFTEGDLRSLAHDDASLAGLVAWYSLIHIPADLHPEVFAGFHRVLRPGGLLLVGFQVGDATARIRDIDFHRLDPDRIATLLKEAGFEPVAQEGRESRWGPSRPVIVGATGVLVAYLLMIGAGLRIALRTTVPFERLLATGLTVLLGVQSFIIIAGVALSCR